MDVIMNPPEVAVSAGKGVTPIMPTEPPPEAKAMEFKYDPKMFEDTGDGTTIKTDNGTEIKPEVVKTEEVTTEVKPAAEVKKEQPTTEVKPEVKKEPKKEEVKAEVKVEPKKEESVKSAIKPISPVKTETADSFDYAKYAPQEVTNMKNMSRQSREAYAKVLDENRQLSTLKDANYLQHEHGYTLSPEYQELVKNDRAALIEGRCWEQSLLDIKAGKAFKEIIGWNNDGSPKLAAERMATDRDEIRISQALQMCINASNNYKGQIQQFPNQFKSRITQDLQNIQQERINRFSWNQDPKLLDSPVDVDGQGTQKISEIKDNVKSIMPAYLRNSPLADWVSDLVVAVHIQSSQLKEALAGKVVAEVKKDEALRAEPSSDDRETESTKADRKGIPKSFSMEGMSLR